MVAPPPWVPMDRKILDKMQDEGQFGLIVKQHFGDFCKEAHFKPVFSDSLMHEAWRAFRWDTERLEGNMPSKPDHFKIGGFAAYWLRRNSPVIALGKDNTVIKHDKVVMGQQKLLAKYGRAFLPFHLGYRICHNFESNRADGGGLSLRLDADYIESMCYVMKYKNVSPHAMGMIYRSLFFGNGGG